MVFSQRTHFTGPAAILSYRDIEEMMLERNIHVDNSTINHWIINYASFLENEFRKNYKKLVNVSWRMDETFIKIKGERYYLYRAVDKTGNTVDFMLSKKRDETAASNKIFKLLLNKIIAA